MARVFFAVLFLIWTLTCGPDLVAARRRKSSGRFNDIERGERLFSLFQIVRFPNDPCSASGNKNGTCYTAEECEQREGVNQGTCANGYGVCCVFTASCGQTSRENITYFESSGNEVGGCRLQICKNTDDICQLRLDFNMFIISGPSTSQTSSSNVQFGLPAQAGAKGRSATAASVCMTDRFYVSSPGGTAPPVLCGTLTGEHVYVDASPMCNNLDFQLGGLLSTRQWNIKVTQYSCKYPNLAPNGCTQYYFGSDTGQARTFNFDSGQHLSNQNQNICIRTERGNCRICFSAAAITDFQVSGMSNSGYNKEEICCGYGSVGTATAGADCVLIPGALTTNNNPAQGQICGSGVGLVKSTGKTAVTICSTLQPFSVRFVSDTFEFVDESKRMQSGFRLTYVQDSMGCA